jgi:hypothetical protein
MYSTYWSAGRRRQASQVQWWNKSRIVSGTKQVKIRKNLNLKTWRQKNIWGPRSILLICMIYMIHKLYDKIYDVMWYDIRYDMIWYTIWYVMWCDVMWCDVMWYDTIRYMIYHIRYTIYDIWYDIWCYMIYDMIWYDMIWYDIILYDMIYDIWYDMIWYDTIRYDMICDLMWYDMIWYMIWYIWLNWVATRWQAVQYTFTHKQYIEQHNSLIRNVSKVHTF